MTDTRCSSAMWPSGRAENKTLFHQHLCNNYINPLVPQFNGSTGDHPLSNPGSSVWLLRNDSVWADGLGRPEMTHTGALDDILKCHVEIFNCSWNSQCHLLITVFIRSCPNYHINHNGRSTIFVFIVEYKFQEHHYNTTNVGSFEPVALHRMWH